MPQRSTLLGGRLSILIVRLLPLLLLARVVLKLIFILNVGRSRGGLRRRVLPSQRPRRFGEEVLQQLRRVE